MITNELRRTINTISQLGFRCGQESSQPAIPMYIGSIGVRQESNPQSATAYSSVRYSQVYEQCDTSTFKINNMRTFLISFILVFMLSCVPENEDNTIVIGDKSAKYEIIKLNPELTVLPSRKDSLDLNSDRNFDIVFVKSPKPAITGYGSETNILIKNGLQIVLSSINNYPDTLSSKAVLNDNTNWSAIESSKLALQSFECGGIDGCVGFANFINVSDKYIGFKSGKNFGWIKIDNSQWELKIKEYTELK